MFLFVCLCLFVYLFILGEAYIPEHALWRREETLQE